MSEVQAAEMLDWLRVLFVVQLAFGAAVLVVATAAAVVLLWGGARG